MGNFMLKMAQEQMGTGNLEAKGYGEDMPITTNKTSYGRSQNRRVEVKLIN